MGERRFPLLEPQSRIGLTFIIFMLIQIILFIMLILSSINVQFLGQNLKNRISQNSQPFANVFLSIFLNNIKVATLEVIPVLGIFFFFLAIFDTGIEISSYSVETHASLFTKLHFFILPATFIELSAYSIALVLNLYILTMMIAMKQRRDRVLINAAYFYGLMILILFIAALFETVNIKYPLYWGTYFDVYWIFAIPVIIVLFMLYWYYIKPNLSIKDERQYY